MPMDDIVTLDTRCAARGGQSVPARVCADMMELSPELVASILVVDDEIQVLSFIMELLRLQGYGVEGTWDPDEALRLARAHSGPVHLLLTDLVMPVMTGPELAKEIRRIHPAMKVLFMSAYTVETAQDYEVWLAPGEPFLNKPFDIATLGRTVRTALNYERPPSAPAPAE
jgi:two-component system cell cycle sensor histidine kinase/response regulator CckA